MRTTLGVQAILGHAQALHGPAGDQMLGNNGFGILRPDVAVPNGFRINNHHGAVLALVEAAGFVDAHAAGKPGGFGEPLQAGVQIACAVARAGGPRRFRRASIVADKHVTLKAGQTAFLLVNNFRLQLRPGRGKIVLFRPKPARICENDCLNMSTDNLLSLKDDMVAFIEGHGLRRLPGFVTEDIPSILWEGKGNPDAWKDFVEMAKHVGAPFVTFSEMTLDRDEVDALVREAGEMNFPDEEATELVEAKWLRKYAGMLGYIQLGFVYQGLVFLHETTTEWYERYQTLLEDIESFQDIMIDDAHPDDEDE